MRAFARGLAVIEAMGAGPRARTIAEVAEATGLPRSVAKRLLLTLCDQDYAQTDGKHFSLTPRVLTLGLAYVRTLPYWPYAQPALEELRAAVGESCSMGVLHGTEIVYVLRIPSRRILATSLNIGSRLPAHLVSIGQVLLAGLDQPALDDYLRGMQADAAALRTAAERKAFVAHLQAVRRKGYAWVEGLLDPVISGIGVPVRDPAGNVVAGINVSLITGTCDEAGAVERLLVPLRRAAEQIRSAMPRDRA